MSTSSVSTTTLPNLTDHLYKVWLYLSWLFSLRITWIVILTVSLILIVFNLVKKYQQKRSGLLSTKIEKQIETTKHNSKRTIYKDFFEQIYYPSWFSLLLVLVPFSILFIFSRLSHLWSISIPNLVFDTSSHFQNLIAVHAGVGAIIFALLIFVAESLRDDETKDRARVLLRESFLFPLTVSEIVSFFIFIWGDINVFSIVPVIIVAILTIISLWRLLEVLLNKSKFAAKRLKLLKERVDRSINLAIEERIGDNIFIQTFSEEKNGLRYYPFSIDGSEKTGRIFIHSDKTGLVVDIRIDKLEEVARLIESESNKNGYSMFKNKPKPQQASSETAQSEFVQQAVYNHNSKNYIHKKYRDVIDEEDKLLVSVDGNAIKDKNIISQITKLTKEAFIIKPGENFSEEMKLEIAGLEGQFIEAINNKRSDKVGELTKTYVNLAESFLEAINKFGGGYSYEQARKERGSIMGGWNEVQWIARSIHDIFEKAIQSQDKKIVLDVAYLPIAIAIRSIKFKDQYLFQEFIRFPVRLYYLAVKESEGDLKDLMIDRSWRHLKEMSDYYIENQLQRKVDDVESIRQYAEFTKPLFSAFQDLLKASFDNRDKSSFSTFLEQFSKTYSHLDLDYGGHSSEYLEQSLSWVTDKDQQDVLRSRILVQKERENATDDIKLKKQQIILGLSAYIFEKYKQNSTNVELRNFYNEISNRLPTQLSELTSLYQSTRTHEAEDFWGWDNWETIPDGEVHIIDVHSKQDRLYCVKALQILAPMTDEQISAINLPTSRDFAFLVEDRSGGHTIIPILDDIKTNLASWLFVLNEAAISKVDKFKSLLQKAKDEQEKKEDEYLQSVELNSSKLEEFKSKIKEAFYSTVRLKPVMDRLGIYKKLLDEVPGKSVPSYGYNQLDNKAAFIEKWHVHYSGWGDTYGEGMASSEDQLIFEQLVNGVEIRKDVAKEDIITEIEKSVQGYQNPVVIQTLEYLYEYDSIKHSDRFIDRYRHDCPKTSFSDLKSFLGVIKLAEQNVPVIDMFVRDKQLENKIIVTDLEKLGILNQYAPIDKPEDAAYQYDIFFLKVDDLNKDDDQRNTILEQNPEWLQQHVDKEAYLKSHVVVRLYQKFKFEIKDPQKGTCLTVIKPTQSHN